MSIFRRCKHDWNVVAVQPFTLMSRTIWDPEWSDCGEETVVRYVCSKCKDDRRRTADGIFTLAEAKVVFPKP